MKASGLLAVVSAGALTTSIWLASGVTSVHAADSDKCGVLYKACAYADDDQFEVTADRRAMPVSARHTVRAIAQTQRRALVARPGVVTERTTLPACPGNHPAVGDGICGSAVMACSDRGGFAMHSWTRNRSTRTGQSSAWGRRPGFTCFGQPAVPRAPAAPPVVDPRVAIPGMVNRQFQELVVLKAVTVVQPADRTLVNVETIFFTESPRSYVLPVVMVAGVPVSITARALSYTWHFGDGEVLRTTDPGARGEKVVTHTYSRAGRVAPYVVVEWGGTYRVGADPAVLEVEGVAVTQGPPTALAAHEARTQLEAGPR